MNAACSISDALFRLPCARGSTLSHPAQPCHRLFGLGGVRGPAARYMHPYMMVQALG